MNYVKLLKLYKYTFLQTEKTALALEGKVVHKADCKPVFNKAFCNLKRKQREDANKQEKMTKLIDEAQVRDKYKPINITKEEVCSYLLHFLSNESHCMVATISG